MIGLGVKLALAPLLAAQGLLARQRIPRLPEAAGAREGRTGRGPVLRLLVAGDSSAAGVGVADQRQALAAPLAERLARRLELQVSWSLIAESGLTTAQVHERLRALPLTTWDLAVIVSGVNDVVDQVPSHHAVAEREALANRLRNAHGVRHVAFVPLPPIHRFPGLPQPLRWVAGADARRHNHALRDWAASRDDVSFVDIDMTLDASTMADDGFHPGAPVYRHCAEAIARHLAARQGSSLHH